MNITDYACPHCGSNKNIRVLGYMVWAPEIGRWTLDEDMDGPYCHECESFIDTRYDLVPVKWETREELCTQDRSIHWEDKA